MASRARPQVAWLPEVMRGRAMLLSRTALGTVATLLLATPGRAQPAANARPGGGVVTAGSASIGSSASTTTITQSSQRAAINWQSFNVGSRQTVDFVQPSSSAVALNRVISPNPSQIAGRIDANGQIILLNQSGVIFYQGAQVNTAGLIVSAAGMSDVNFMAGKLVFDQAAQPNAAVVNQGTLTVGQAGLAALVAPQVVNSGVITAKLGQVVLAGAKTATLDLYGDGLLALDVGNAVTQAPAGPGGQLVTALVTNTGVIRADGGTVQLTAREADGLVQDLVRAGGKISTDSVGSKTGTVVLGGIGGSIVLSGVVTAEGRAPGSVGGQVQVDASQGVALAAGSRINTSGAAGGGTVAIGTTLARAKGGPGTASALTANTVQIAHGARIAANATADGDGGRVTVLSSLSTSMAGNISAKGGPQGGDGGFVEVSGEQAFTLTGTIDVSALLGNLGTILLDPANLTIIGTAGDQDGNLNTNHGTISFGGANTTNNSVSNTEIEAQTGNIVLQAVTDITVSAPINLTTPGQALTLQAGDNLQVKSGASITTQGNITLSAADSAITGFAASGGLQLLDTVSTNSGTVKLSAGTTGISLKGNVTGTVVDLDTTGGGVTQASTNVIDAGTLVSSATLSGNVSLLGTQNIIHGSTGLTTSGGDIVMVDNAPALALTGSYSAGNLFFEVNRANGTLAIGSGVTAATLTATAGTNPRISLVADNVTGASGSTVTATGGSVELAPASARAVNLSGAALPGTLTVDSALLSDISTGAGGTLVVGGFTDVPHGGTVPVASATAISVGAATSLTSIAGTLDLLTSGLVSQTGALTVGTLIGNAGTVVLGTSGNAISALDGFAATKAGFTLTDVSNTDLVVSGSLTAAGAIVLSTSGTGSITATASIGAATTLSISSGNGGIELNTGAVLTGPTINLNGAAGGIALLHDASLGGTGALLDLAASGGGVTEAATSTITAGTLQTSGSITGGLTLVGTGNAIGTLGSIVVNAGTIDVLDTGSLSVAGAVTAPFITLSAGTLGISGTLGGIGTLLPTTTLVALGASAGITEAGLGVVNAATLTSDGTITGGLTLVGTGNAIGMLGSIVVNAGTIDVLDTGSLSVAGAVTAPFITLSAGTLGFDGTLGGIGTLLPTTTLVALGASAGGITEAGSGVVNTATLESIGTITGGLTLVGTGNAIGMLGSIVVNTGTIDVLDTGSLSVAGAVTAPFITLSAGTLGVDGTLGGIGTLLPMTTLVALGASAGGITEAASGVVNAATLESIGTITGGLMLVGTGNAIGTLGSILVNTGTIDVLDTGSLSVVGVVTAPFVTLSAGTLGIVGTLGGIGTLLPTTTLVALGASAGITEAVTGVVNAATLTSDGTITGGMTLAGTGNAIAALGRILVNTGTIDVLDTGSLSVAGAVTAPFITLSAGTLGIAGTLGGGGTLLPTTTLVALGASAGITEASTGVVNAATLTSDGTIIGGLTLVGTGNAIATLGSILVNTGTIDVLDTGSLSVAGTVTAPFITLSAGTLGISGTLGGIGTLLPTTTLVALGAGAGITEASTGVVNAATLTSDGTITGGLTLVGTTNAIGTLDRIVVNTGTIDVLDTGSLSVAGTVTAPFITLSAGTLGIAGTLGGSGTLLPTATLVALGASAGGITEAGSRVVNAATLTSDGTITGGLTLVGTGNAIGTLGSIVVNTGTIDVLDTGSLSVAGAVTAPFITLSAGTLGISGTLGGIGTLLPTTTLVALGASVGGITEAGTAVVNAATLESIGTISGAVTLAGTANAIGDLANFAVSGTTNGLALLDGPALTVDGTVTAPGNIYLESSDPLGITIAAGGSVGAGTAALASFQTDVFSNAGSVTGGTFELAPNTVGNLVTLGTMTTGLSLADLTDINVGTVRIGAVTQPDGTLATTAGSIAIVAPGFTLTGTTTTLALDARAVGVGTGDVGQTSSLVDVGTLTGTAASYTLTNGGNTIAALGNITATTGTLGVVDAGSLSVAGMVTGPFITLSAGTLGISGTLGGIGTLLPTTTLVALGASAGITEASTGVVNAATLTSDGTITGGLTLVGTGNAIGTLGSILVNTGTIDVLDTGSLSVAGTVTAPFITLSAGTLGIAGTLGGIGALLPTTTLVSLGASAGITEVGTGVVNAATLTSDGTITGGLTLVGTGNAIGTLGSVVVNTGTIDVLDTGSLSVAGTVTAPFITLSAGTLGIAGTLGGIGTLLPTTTLVALGASAAGITEAGSGVVNAATLTSDGTITGGMTLVGTGNAIGTLGSILVNTGTIDVLDTDSLSVAGTVTAPFITLSAGTLGIAGTLGGIGALLPTTLVALGASAGGITEASMGVVNAATLTSDGTIISGLTLVGTGNTIGALGSILVNTGTIDVLDTGSLSVGGTVTAPFITLSAGTLGIAGTLGGIGAMLPTTTRVSLGASAGITEVGTGVVNAATLTSDGTITGGLTLVGTGNAIGTLGSIVVNTGTIDVLDTGSLSVAGTVTAPFITLSAGTLGITGTLGGIGTLLPTTTLVALGASAAGITEAGSGVVNAATLTSDGTITGGLTLVGTGNAIGTLGSILVNTGTIDVLDTGSLSVEGTVTAPFITLSAGTLGIAGTLGGIGALLPTTLVALGASAGGITEASTGLVNAATLTSDGTIIGGLTLVGTGNTIGTLGSILVNTGTIDVLDTGSLSVAGTVTAPFITLSAGTLGISGTLGGSGTLLPATTLVALGASAGGITEAGSGVVNAATLTSDGTITGGLTLVGTGNAIGALGSIVVNTGTIDVLDNGSLSVAGTVTAPFITLSAGTLGITGTLGGVGALLPTTTLVALGAGAGITEASTGVVNAATLASDGAITGGLTLVGSGNAIGTLGSILVNTGTIDVLDTGSLSVAGTVTASFITLSAGTLGIAGTLGGGGTLLPATTLVALGASAGITEASTGVVNAATLTSDGTITGGLTLVGTGNAIGTLGSIVVNTGTIDVLDTGSLSVAGAVTAPFITLSAGTLGISGMLGGIGALLPTTTLVALGASAGVTESSTGVVNAATLTSDGTITGGMTLVGTGNAIGTLGSILVNTGTIDVLDTGSLSVAGTVTAPFITLSAGTLGIAGTLGGIGTQLPMTTLIALGASSGGITEASTGVVNAATLTSDGTIIGGLTLVGTGNAIATLGSIVVNTGTIDVLDTGSLSVAGTVTAPFITLSAGMLWISGTLGGIGTLLPTTTLVALGASAGITEASTAVVNTATLTSDGTITGGLTLASTGNAIGALGSIVVNTGTIDVLDTGSLSVAGTVTAPFITLSAGTLGISGTLGGIGALLPTTTLVALGASSGITEASTGVVNAATLTSDGTITGGLTLVGTGNAIGTLGSILVNTGTIDVLDTGSLSVAGTVTAPFITLSAGTLGISGTFGGIGTLLPTTTLLALGASAGGITEASTGVVNAATLTSDGTITGGLTLVGTGNAIATLGSILVNTGTIDVLDTGSLSVAGVVTAPFITLSAGTLGIAGTLGGVGTLLPTTTLVALGASAGVTESSPGVVNAATLTSDGTIIGGMTLVGTGNAIGTLGSILVNTGTIDVLDTGSLSVAGTVTAPFITLSAGTLGIAGTLGGIGTQLPMTTLIALGASSGGITEASTGVVNAATLTSDETIIGGLTLVGTGNAIATLGSIVVNTGTIDVLDTGSLSVAGTVTAPFITLSAGMLGISGTLGGIGTLLPTTTLVALGASAGITEATTGVLNAATLTSDGTITGGLTLASTGNAIGALGSIVVNTGTIDVLDTGSLSVAGTVTAPFITLSAGTLGISGTLGGIGALLPTTTLVALGASSGITEASTGVVNAATLTSDGTITGGLTLVGTGNAIGTLGSILVNTGTIDVLDTGSLSVAGTVTAPFITLSAGTLGISGTFGGIGTLLPTTTLLALGASAGGITEASTGVVNAATLTSDGTITGGLTLVGTGNAIATLGSILVNTGTIDVLDTGSLSVAGVVTAPFITLSAGTLGIAGTLGGVGTLLPTTTLVALGANSGGITEANSGVVNAATLTSDGTITGGLTLVGTGNAIGTLGSILVNTGTIDVLDTGSLSVAGAVTAPFITLSAGTLGIAGTLGGVGTLLPTTTLVALGASAGITEASTGVLNAATLSSDGTITGGLTLVGTGNAIGTLGSILVNTGTLGVLDTGSLSVAGVVTAPFITLSAGTLGISGTLGGSGTLLPTTTLVALGASAGITEASTGVVNAATLISDGTIIGGLTLVGTGNTIATLGSILVNTGTIDVLDTGSLSVAGVVTAPFITLSAGTLGIAGTLGGIGALLPTTTLVALGASAGGITEATTGVVNTATLESIGTIISAATLAGIANAIGTLEAFTAGSSLALTDRTALTLAGTISAPLLVINTGTSALTLAGGTTIDTGGTTAPNHLTIARNELPTGGAGAYFTSSTFGQTGTTQVNLIGGGRNSVLSITGTAAGNDSVALTGATTWLILNLAPGSNVTGNVNVNALTVVLPPNDSNTSQFSVALTGSVAGFAGQEAASASGVIPLRGATLRVNNCPIGTANCVLLSGALVPVGNPLQNLALGILINPNDEGDLLLPLVSDEDFLTCLLRKDCN